ncbi:MAG: rhamnulokinase [Gaiellaceae bacterium]
MGAARLFAAVDLGAESGRVVGARFDGERLTLHEVHRFANTPLRAGGELRWDIRRLFDETLRGLARAANEFGEFTSVGVDSWGVDFALLDHSGELIGNPFHYRDRRASGIPARVEAVVPREEVFAATGAQLSEVSTLCQLYAMALDRSPELERAETLLLVPDLVNFWLSGQKLCELTIASTTGVLDTGTGAWALELTERLGLPARILPRLVPPATTIGPLLPAIADGTGATATVVAPGCHDTASAVAAIPLSSGDSAYISSGTWSLLGVVSNEPCLDPLTRDLGFTNETGVDGTIRVLKNLTGLWLVQECRRAWSLAGEKLSYEQLTGLAERAAPFQALVDPEHPVFRNPADMPSAIGLFCSETGQPPPLDRGAVVRAALEGLACSYRRAIEQLERLRQLRVDAIHVVGGGARNRLLCQITADACARPVLAGPIESTALGNVLAQAIATGSCGSWAEACALVRRSFPSTLYEPRESGAWDDAYARFLSLAR